MAGKDFLALEATRNALDLTLGEFRVLADMLENLPSDDVSYLMARDNLCQRTIEKAVVGIGEAVKDLSRMLEEPEDGLGLDLDRPETWASA